MKKVVGETIDSVTSWDREVAMIFANETKAAARDYVKLRQLKADLAKAQSEQATALKDVSNAQAGVKRAQAALDEAEELKPAMTKEKVLIFSLLGLLLLIVGAVIVYVILNGKLQKEQAIYDEAVDDAQRALQKHQSTLKEAEGRKNASEAEVQRLMQAIADTTPAQKSFAIGRVFYPLKVADLAGYKVAIDYAGNQSKDKFQIPDLAADEDTLEDIGDNIKDIAEPPVLLAPRKDDEEGLEELIGEERLLKNTMDMYEQVVDAIDVLECHLPLTPKDGSIASILNDKNIRPDPVAGIDMQTEGKAQLFDQMDSLSNLVERQRRVGGNVSEQLMNSYRSVKESVELYSGLRQNAHAFQNDGLRQILTRSDWLAHNFYCPECNRIPDYLYDDIGLEPDDVHTKSFNEIIGLLTQRAESTGDKEMTARIDTALDEFQERYKATKRLEEELRNLDPDDPNLRRQTKILEAEFTKHQTLLAMTYESLVLGPKVSELNPSTRLKYDPHKDLWKCPTCPCMWDEDETSPHMFGKVKKIKEQVLLPLWNNLWNEKQDLVTTETKRSSEELRMRSTQEGDRLQGIANKYSDDMRPVRLKMGELVSRMASKRIQLIDTLDSLEEMGLMDKEKSQRMRRAVEDMGDTDVLNEMAAQNEWLLEREKALVTERRPQVFDIKEQLKSPSFLFSMREFHEGIELIENGGAEQMSSPSAPSAVDGAQGTEEAPLLETSQDLDELVPPVMDTPLAMPELVETPTSETAPVEAAEIPPVSNVAGEAPEEASADGDDLELDLEEAADSNDSELPGDDSEEAPETNEGSA